MFIEGGSYIGQKPESESSEPDLSDADRWTVFYLYRKDNPADGAGPGSYIFVGYSTVYRFYWFQPPTPPASPGDRWELPNGDTDLANLPCRTRLSQFVILPPFQGRGMGARLYNTIFQYYQDHKQTQEFTVEDPNEAFDHLRDVCDLTFLRSVPEFNNLRLDTSVTIPKSGPLPQLITNGDKLEALRQKTKIASRQFYRVLEMHLMSQLPESVRPKVDVDKVVPAPTKADRHQERLWELVAKQRLYRHNKEALSQIELDERIEKLSEVLQGVGFEYARLLEIYERSRQHSQNANGKRKLDDTSSTANKRPRTDDA
jgi:histone acetyltransferase 1